MQLCMLDRILKPDGSLDQPCFVGPLNLVAKLQPCNTFEHILIPTKKEGKN